MKFNRTKIPEVITITPDIFGDQRGYFYESFQKLEFSTNGIDEEFVQDNHSGSSRGTLRGLHYQINQPQGKLIRVVIGEIFDVAVDLRGSSPTFRDWVGIRISAEEKNQVWVPKGFAHGFYVLSEWAEVIYKTTDYYAPEWERTLLWNDPDLAIDWPIDPSSPLLISSKDDRGMRLESADVFE